MCVTKMTIVGINAVLLQPEKRLKAPNALCWSMFVNGDVLLFVFFEFERWVHT